MRQGSQLGFSFFCGGTILDSTTILTAAHCYYGKDLTASDFYIAAGITHIQVIYFQQITAHSYQLLKSY